MDPVLGVVDDVVQDVDRPREEAEDDESGDGLEEKRDVEDLEGEDDRGEDEGVLRPLLRPEGAEDGAERPDLRLLVGGILHELPFRRHPGRIPA